MRPSFSSVTATDVSSPLNTIPQSFMGFSHEWPYVEELYDIPAYEDIIKLLSSYGSGPINLRIGGGSTDKLVTVPAQNVWSSLSKLHRDTGMKFIIGLNFFHQDLGLSKGQMDAASGGLPAGSIEGFEIGNEVSHSSFPFNLAARQMYRCHLVLYNLAAAQLQVVVLVKPM